MRLRTMTRFLSTAQWFRVTTTCGIATFLRSSSLSATALYTSDMHPYTVDWSAWRQEGQTSAINVCSYSCDSTAEKTKLELTWHILNKIMFKRTRSLSNAICDTRNLSEYNSMTLTFRVAWSHNLTCISSHIKIMGSQHIGVTTSTLPF